MWSKLRNYQIDAVDQLSCGKILCGGVGSGKSLTALAYYYKTQGGNLLLDIQEPMTNPVDLYIITTATKRNKKEWDEEMLYFYLSPDPAKNSYKNQVVVDSWNNITKYSKVKDAFFIFDEHRAGGDGPWAKAFVKIAKKNHWILLSATPGDTWIEYAPVFIANGFYKDISEFKKMHVTYRPFVSFPMIDHNHYLGTKRLERLRSDILVDMDFMRPTESHHHTIPVSYPKDIYKLAMKERMNPFTHEPIDTASSLCYCLRKIVNSDLSRGEQVKILVRQHKKAVIFYNFDYELEILKELKYGKGVDIAEWNGHKHEPLPTGKSWVYLVQYNAGAEGWNCITTDTMIFYSQNYSYKAMTQAAGRIDRMNTPYKDLYYYHFNSYSSIDLAIEKALSRKKKFNERDFAGR